MFLLWLRQLPPCEGWTPLQFLHPPKAGPVLLTLLFFPLLSFAWLCILFLWSGTPVCSQLAFYMHFCVWRCIPVSVERDVLHIHLLLHHLVLQNSNCYISTLFSRTFLLFFKDKFFKGNFFEQFYKYLFIMWHHKSTYGFNIKLQKYRIQWNHLGPFCILLKYHGYSSWGCRVGHKWAHTHDSTWLSYFRILKSKIKVA